MTNQPTPPPALTPQERYRPRDLVESVMLEIIRSGSFRAPIAAAIAAERGATLEQAAMALEERAAAWWRSAQVDRATLIGPEYHEARECAALVRGMKEKP